MPQVNRYTQMPAPLVVNPLSFDELARVPLAKAQASAEGVAALDRIKTNFNVDDKDLNKISSLVQTIDDTKDKVVEGITNSGVTTQTISEVLNLKKNRDQLYKNTIAQAEENKKRIDTWRNQVDEMTMKGAHPGWYADIIKGNVYDKGWQGSFQEGSDTPSTFVGNFGATYIDMEKDISDELFRAASKGTTTTTPIPGNSGSFTSEKNPVTGEILSAYVSRSPGQKTVATNKANLEATIKMLESEYTDPTTERGKFSEYAGVPKEAIKGIIQKYKDMYLNVVDSMEPGAYSKQFVGGSGKDKEETRENNYVSVEKIRIPLNNMKEVTNSTGGTDRVKKLQSFNDRSGKAYDADPSAPIDWAHFVNMIVPGVGGFINFFVKGGKKGQWDLNNMNPTGQSFKTMANSIIGTASNSIEANKKKIQIMKDPNIAIAFEDMIIKGKINKGVVEQGIAGNPKLTDYVYDQLIDYMSEVKETEVKPNIITTNYTLTKYGEKRDKVGVIESAKDLFTGSFNVIDTRTGLVIKGDSKLSKELKVKGKTGTMKVDGNVPLWSPLLLDRETGQYMEGYAGAYHVSDLDNDATKNKGSFLAPLQSDLKETPDYERIDELNIIGLPLPKGVSTLIFMTDDGESYYPVELLADPRQGDPTDLSVSSTGRPDKNMLYRTMDGSVYQVRDEDQNRIVGPAFAQKYKLNLIRP